MDTELQRRGFAFVTQPGETFSPRDAARIERTVELLAGMEDRSWPFRRRRRRPLWRRWQRLWTHRPWKPLAVLGAVALFSTLLATEFRISDYREPERATPPGRTAVQPAPAANPIGVHTAAPAPPMPAVAAATPSSAPAGPGEAAPAAAPAVEPTPAEAAPASAAAPADRQRDAGAMTFFAPLAPSAAPRAGAAEPDARRPAAEREATVKPKATPALTVVAAAASAAPAPAPAPDLKLELSRRPTSATGGGFVYTVRVTDLDGQPRPDAEVWLSAGRRPSGPLFQTRLHPAESAGTYRSGVVHPGTLPPDMMVKAQVGNRRVEAPVER